MPDSPPVVAARGLTRRHRVGDQVVHALEDVDLDVAAGTCTAITGPSGSGKTTLLSCLGLMDRPDAGTLELCGEPVHGLGERRRTELRRRHVGFVFQQFHLLPHLDAIENVLLPTTFGRADGDERARAAALLERVGLGARTAHRPAQLSGGERQRVAIARALVNRPGLLLADEPTGNLDTQTAAGIVELLASLAEEGPAVVVVTHDPAVAAVASQVHAMRDGRLLQAPEAAAKEA